MNKKELEELIEKIDEEEFFSTHDTYPQDLIGELLEAEAIKALKEIFGLEVKYLVNGFLKYDSSYDPVRQYVFTINGGDPLGFEVYHNSWGDSGESPSLYDICKAEVRLVERWEVV